MEHCSAPRGANGDAWTIGIDTRCTFTDVALMGSDAVRMSMASVFRTYPAKAMGPSGPMAAALLTIEIDLHRFEGIRN
ncbi:MAG: hypothetical protein EPN30_02870 [Actinomycetota bacterium]|nr:MAG: hypothetical protein EPN30_02870 [Actinomycetota bacterium]